MHVLRLGSGRLDNGVRGPIHAGTRPVPSGRVDACLLHVREGEPHSTGLNDPLGDHQTFDERLFLVRDVGIVLRSVACTEIFSDVAEFFVQLACNFEFTKTPRESCLAAYDYCLARTRRPPTA